MYLEKIVLKNVGPIDSLNVDLPFNENSKPLPIVFVGENGTGKSIVLSFIVNALIWARQQIYKITEVQEGTFYKALSSLYIKTGKNFSYSYLDFESGFKYVELQLNSTKGTFNPEVLYPPLYRVHSRFVEENIKALQNKEKIYSNFLGQLFYVKGQKSSTISISSTIEHVFGIYLSTFWECTSLYKIWENIPEDEVAFFRTNFPENKQKLKELQDKNCCLYFPSNRFEEPAWLNKENLLSKARFSSELLTMGLTNRFIIMENILKNIQHWLLDITYDSRVLELKTMKIPLIAFQHEAIRQLEEMLSGKGKEFEEIRKELRKRIWVDIAVGSDHVNHIIESEGHSAKFYNLIISLFKKIFSTKKDIRFGIGPRKNRLIHIMKDNQDWIPSLFSLSTGEGILFSLFSSILMDYDLAGNTIETSKDIRGIVLIDEIDLHLHTGLQKNVLPELISIFPKIQFIITTHSPLFLLGMKDKFGEDGFEIREMPDGNKITIERFKEFEKAYEVFKNTKKFEEDIRESLKQAQKPIVFVEGDYDIKYINKAFELLNKKDLLAKVVLKDGGGFGNLDKIKKHFNSKLSEITPQKIILLYDCDIKKTEAIEGNVVTSVVPSINNNPIKKGIENLFTLSTIEKVINDNKNFINITEETKKTIRGEEKIEPKKYEVDKDEKRNLCDWLCVNGTKEDFVNFHCIFELIESKIRNP